MGQGHWLGEWAPSDSLPCHPQHVAFSFMITKWLPHLQMWYPHSRKEKGGRGLQAEPTPFHWKAVALTRRPLQRPLHPLPADFHLTLSLVRMGYIVSHSSKGTWESKLFGWASCCSKQIGLLLRKKRKVGLDLTQPGWPSGPVG